MQIGVGIFPQTSGGAVASAIAALLAKRDDFLRFPDGTIMRSPDGTAFRWIRPAFIPAAIGDTYRGEEITLFSATGQTQIRIANPAGRTLPQDFFFAIRVGGELILDSSAATFTADVSGSARWGWPEGRPLGVVASLEVS